MEMKWSSVSGKSCAPVVACTMPGFSACDAAKSSVSTTSFSVPTEGVRVDARFVFADLFRLLLVTSKSGVGSRPS